MLFAQGNNLVRRGTSMCNLPIIGQGQGHRSGSGSSEIGSSFYSNKSRVQQAKPRTTQMNCHNMCQAEQAVSECSEIKYSPQLVLSDIMEWDRLLSAEYQDVSIPWVPAASSHQGFTPQPGSLRTWCCIPSFLTHTQPSMNLVQFEFIMIICDPFTTLNLPEGA